MGCLRARERGRNDSGSLQGNEVVSLCSYAGDIAVDARGRGASSAGNRTGESGWAAAEGRTLRSSAGPRGSAGLSCGWRARPLSKPGARMRQQLVAFL